MSIAFPALLTTDDHLQTANTITYAVHMPAEHPKVLDRLRKEILQVVGESSRPTYQDVKDMRYLRAVIKPAFFVEVRDRLEPFSRTIDAIKSGTNR